MPPRYLLGLGAWSDRSAKVLSTAVDSPVRLAAIAAEHPRIPDELKAENRHATSQSQEFSGRLRRAGRARGAGASAITWDELQHRASTTPLPAGSVILVLLTMYGGNDGITP